MRHLKSILLAFGVAIVIILVIPFFLKTHYKIEKKVLIKSGSEEISSYIQNLHQWPKWTAWNDKKYNSLEISFAGPESGPGSAMHWKADGDEGNVTVKSIVPQKNILFDVVLENDFVTNGTIHLNPTLEGTEVKWVMSGDDGNHFLGRYFILFADEFLASDLEIGLNNLKKICEKD